MTSALWTPEILPSGVARVRVASDDEPWLGPDFLDRWDGLAQQVADDPRVRAVVVEGGERHFCSGAPRAALLAPDADRAVSDYAARLPARLLEFPLPTVAAMAGHAVGGGLLVGLWCDVAFLAEESLYGANFMALGFTPGMGSTIALEAAFGGSLAREMLYTGRLLKGRDLGGPLARYVAPRAQVVSRAVVLAQEVATAPRAALVELKRALAEVRRAAAGPAVEREREAHRRLFAQPETARAIEERYPEPPRIERERP